MGSVKLYEAVSARTGRLPLQSITLSNCRRPVIMKDFYSAQSSFHVDVLSSPSSTNNALNNGRIECFATAISFHTITPSLFILVFSLSINNMFSPGTVPFYIVL